MGSNFKSSVLEEQTVKAIRQWHAEVKQKRKKNQKASNHDYSSTTTIGHSNRSSTFTASPDHHQYFSSRHNRSPTFADQIPRLPIDSEIVEDRDTTQDHDRHQSDQIRDLGRSVIVPSDRVHDEDMQAHHSDEKPILTN